jgi:hypothetical protein
MPIEAIDDPFVHNEIVGRVLDIRDIGANHRGGGVFDVPIALATVTIGGDAGGARGRHLRLLAVPPLTWLQFRATGEEPLGSLCMVNAVHDKPQLPTPEELVEVEQYPRIVDFLNGAR